MAEALGPMDAVTGGALGETGAGGGADLGGAHRITVVFDDKDAGQIPEGGEIHGLVHGTLVDGAVAHESHGGPFVALVFNAVGEADAEGDLATDDAVAAPIVVGRVKIVHRSTLALGATGDLAV